MQQTLRRYHRWTTEEVSYIKEHYEFTEASQEAMRIYLNGRLDDGNVPITPHSMADQIHQHFCSLALPTFDYTKIRPLTALFTRCPVCGGTTTVNHTAYCCSCGSQWHPLSRNPLTQVSEDGHILNLHPFDRNY